MKKLNVTSETGRLRRVIVHTPGREVEAMRPSAAEEDLYNDIIPMDLVIREHAELKGFLGQVAEVHELRDILVAALATPAQRSLFASELAGFFGAQHRLEELKTMTAAALADAAICGLPARHISLDRFLVGCDHDIKPLPNMYFMRDAAMVYRDRSIASAMRFPVRRVEALIHRFIFAHHPDFSGGGCLLDGPALAADGFSLEGGDFQVLGKNLLAIGVSERTSARGIDAIARAVTQQYPEPVSVFAVMLPIARATIHLDMAFTVIDRDACLVFAPVITGPRRARVVRIDAAPGREPVLIEVDSLLGGLKSAGLDLQPVFTGGDDPVRAEREQWLSGANSFSFAPGKILMYACNKYTAEALTKSGFEFKHATDFLSGTIDPLSYQRLVVGFDGVELARGGGGARCMTCPIQRDDL
ncbi:MAG: hypothetical protein A2087_09540 [Spirochaetes bacterium GWD1_61_31]|nr:MAG: hypothetical protein A2Y37_13790 [Spirochaetes bacterium GWB1_60_80]OHD39278.1 MAG: hypothetical protein A2087_09540 [Spirochaetes bacterium GWD1_61_31]OHD42087.1 MAG: hypothetical protein A2Y35_07495 [Spirochaetes bacterium GWE1_60_18]OHD60979.1 MAG: hypothetical protein A2Y32_03415 [Spirochaetes bacterium GWF1_60_12]HAP42785.1 hypothetical protein [Spirochaetaceae bacterium]